MNRKRRKQLPRGRRRERQATVLDILAARNFRCTPPIPRIESARRAIGYA